MQPIVGTIADSSKSKWGRRRPFMVGGAIIVGIFLFVLGWTTEIVGIFIADPHLVRTHLRRLLFSVCQGLTAETIEKESHDSPSCVSNLRCGFRHQCRFVTVPSIQWTCSLMDRSAIIVSESHS